MAVGFVFISTGKGRDGGAGDLPNPAGFWVGLVLFAVGACIAWIGSRPLPAQATLPRAGPLTTPADFEIPTTFRNWNFAKSTVAYAAISAALLCLNVVSSWRLAWLGIGLLTVAAAAALFFAASWFLAVLRVEFDHVRLGGLTKRCDIPWDAIEDFSIMDPGDRTPFMINFWPWRDQAHVLLRSGESRRVRAIEPRHGFTVLTYAMVRGDTDADQKVDWLNRFARTRRTFTP
jgi:hypothetical protein